MWKTWWKTPLTCGYDLISVTKCPCQMFVICWFSVKSGVFNIRQKQDHFDRMMNLVSVRRTVKTRRG